MFWQTESEQPALFICKQISKEPGPKVKIGWVELERTFPEVSSQLLYKTESGLALTDRLVNSTLPLVESIWYEKLASHWAKAFCENTETQNINRMSIFWVPLTVSNMNDCTDLYNITGYSS